MRISIFLSKPLKFCQNSLLLSPELKRIQISYSDIQFNLLDLVILVNINITYVLINEWYSVRHFYSYFLLSSYCKEIINQFTLQPY